METYPFDLMPPETERWRLTGVTISGGIPTAGAPGLARTDGGGFWTCWMTNIDLYTREQLKAARALEARLDGGLTPIIVPQFEVPFSAIPEGVDWLFTSAFAAPAPRRATTLSVQHGVGAPLEGGERFSVTHPTMGKRLYGVAEVVSTSALAQVIKIRPPLREAVTTEALDFNTPGCVMRLANPDDFLGAIDAQHSMPANAVWMETFDVA